MRFSRVLFVCALPAVPFVVASCVGDDPVASSDASPSPSNTVTAPTNDGATTPNDAATASDAATGDANADGGAACAPPRLGATSSEEVTAGVPTNLDVRDFSYDCSAYYVVTNVGSVLRRAFTETAWSTVVPPSADKIGWAMQVDDTGIFLAQLDVSSFNGAPGATQRAMEAYRFDKTGTNKTTIFSEAPPATLTAVEFSGPFQRTATTIAFLGTQTNRTVTVVAKRTPTGAQVSGGIGFLTKSVTFDETSIVAGGNMLAWARPVTPGGPAQVTIEGNARTSTIQTLTDSPRATKATLPGFRAITEDYALFRATPAVTGATDVLAACTLQANGGCTLLDAAPFRTTLDYGVTTRSPITSDAKFFAVGLVGPADTGSAVSLCEAAAYGRDNNCASAKIVAQATGPAATRIALSRNDVLVEYPNGTGGRKWVRYPRP